MEKNTSNVQKRELLNDIKKTFDGFLTYKNEHLQHNRNPSISPSAL
jgi:hypothetical protein